MLCIIAPAKRIKTDEVFMSSRHQPFFLEDSRKLLPTLKALNQEQLRRLLKCSPQIAEEARKQYQILDLNKEGTPAILSYDGIQYQTMAPHVFTDEQLDYVERHVRILSGFYGLLRPLDGIHPHRLEMDSPLKTSAFRSLYEFWGDRLYQHLAQSDSVLIDLASAQHARSVSRYAASPVRYIKCWFYEETGMGLREKGVYVKIARGEMIRYLAEIRAENPEQLKTFNRRGYRYQAELSNDHNFVFTRDKGETYETKNRNYRGGRR